MIQKETYFNLVTLKKEFQKRSHELVIEWNEKVCWEGSPEEQEAHENLEKSIRERIAEITTTLSKARESIPKEILKSWADEYYGRK
ncbi:hypothetical protein [Heyndrickxia sporothermodurans]|uniref:hypothetical protein n=1 Tax=Heyndrickxia sporothermodurans TaxID=46224 RepID=UPI00192BCEC6|nr:hypothetical protein [Heyndrickxia sporothermodurans]MBL5830842.1 hypothetical protein [Heyndrickxia sporothermodurans]